MAAAAEHSVVTVVVPGAKDCKEEEHMALPEEKPLPEEMMFYELIWQVWRAAGRDTFPLPWWAQQYMRYWTDDFNSAVFYNIETAFSSNAQYRYWDMVGVKGQAQNCLIGQAGEVEPAEGRHTLSFFIADSDGLHFPQNRGSDTTQERDSRLPVITTSYVSRAGAKVTQTTFGGVVRPDDPFSALTAPAKAVVVARFKVSHARADTHFGLVMLPFGPSGFHYRSRLQGSQPRTRRVEHLAYNRTTALVLVEGRPSVSFTLKPDTFGLYGSDAWLSAGASLDAARDAAWNAARRFLDTSPFSALSRGEQLNERLEAHDHVAGLCSGVFLWRLQGDMEIDVAMLVDDFTGDDDVAAATQASPAAIQAATVDFWTKKLKQGLAVEGELRISDRDIWNLYETCRVNLLTLTTQGRIHPGPTIYNEFWVRDSSVASYAAALVGDSAVAERQVGEFVRQLEGNAQRGDHGFFGGQKERDCNGQALWTIGMLDRILGGFGASRFGSVLEGARWIRKKKDGNMLPPGWSAEHLGDGDRLYYWDDFWALAGLWESARLAERIGAKEADELWNIHSELKTAVARSIEQVMSDLGKKGQCKTFIPASPWDIGPPASTIIGTVAFFHPCRLYGEADFGHHIDQAAESTLETIWDHFVETDIAGRSGFRHDSRDWRSYGPYLTMQLAHCWLLLSALDSQPPASHDECFQRFVQCLKWAVAQAFPSPRDEDGRSVQVVSGAWGEQHCYPVADGKCPFPSWYMGDIPHTWACAEFMLLTRYMLFFEHDIDRRPRIHIGAGLNADIMTGQRLVVRSAPTLFGIPFGFVIEHRLAKRELEVTLTSSPSADVSVHCRFGQIESAEVDGQSLQPSASHRLDVSRTAKKVVLKYRSQ